MNIFAVEYTYADVPGAVSATRPEHRAFLRSLFEEGSLLASGPLPDETTAGALLIIRAGDHSAVSDLLAADPFAQEKLIQATTIRKWNPVIGPWEL